MNVTKTTPEKPMLVPGLDGICNTQVSYKHIEGNKKLVTGITFTLELSGDIFSSSPYAAEFQKNKNLKLNVYDTAISMKHWTPGNRHIEIIKHDFASTIGAKGLCLSAETIHTIYFEHILELNEYFKSR